MRLAFVTHNDFEHFKNGIDTNMSSRRGRVEATYEQLVNVFGKPTVGDEYKTDWEWEIEFADGTVATIYNWKNGPNWHRQYCERGLRADQITVWHVGGFGADALTLVKEALGLI